MSPFRFLCVGALALALVGAAAGAPASAQAARRNKSEPGDLRQALAAKGVVFQFTYTGEALADASGGARTGAIYEHQFNLAVDADLEKLLGWRGASVHANGFWIDGTGGLSQNYVDNILTVSNIEAQRSVRLYEAWFEQKLASGKASVRFGQLGADSEFIVSKYAGLFVNSTYGWPDIMAEDLPSGGPAYPLATPGARLKISPTSAFSALIGVFDGNPAGPCAVSPQTCDPNGVNFRVQDPPLVMTEGRYAYALGGAAGLKGEIKLGAFAHFGKFDSLLLDSTGAPLASPTSEGTPLQLQGDEGVYGVLDQTLYRPRGAADDAAIGAFVRAIYSPPDRNLVDFYLDAGVNFAGLTPGRPHDSFGVAIAYAHISRDQALFEQEYNAFHAADLPIQDYEADIDATYVYQLADGWTLQPDVQYIIHPGGRIPNPDGGAAPIANALVFGLRTTVTF